MTNNNYLIKYKKANLAALEYYSTENFPCGDFNCGGCEQHLVAGRRYSQQQRPIFQWINKIPLGKGGFRKC